VQRVVAPLALAKSSGAEHIEQLKAVDIGGFLFENYIFGVSNGDIITYERFSAFCERK
jgi:hypothetical protein